ncbi:DNA-binding NarL/FixJ family response regulator [Streptomyces sp. SAI-170]
MSIRVLVADDQAIIRTGLRIMLNAQPGIEVVGEAADGREAVRLARELRPDVCLFDIRMPVLDGLEATRLVAGPGVADPLAVVVITTFDLDEYVYGSLRAGARGFLLKDTGADLLAQAVRSASDGEALIAPSVTVRLLQAFADLPARPARGPAGLPRHRPRGAGAPRRRSRADQHRDRRCTAHQPQHGEDASGQPDGETRRPQPGRDRDVGLRNAPYPPRNLSRVPGHVP